MQAYAYHIASYHSRTIHEKESEREKKEEWWTLRGVHITFSEKETKVKKKWKWKEKKVNEKRRKIDEPYVEFTSPSEKRKNVKEKKLNGSLRDVRITSSCIGSWMVAYGMYPLLPHA